MFTIIIFNLKLFLVPLAESSLSGPRTPRWETLQTVGLWAVAGDLSVSCLSAGLHLPTSVQSHWLSLLQASRSHFLLACVQICTLWLLWHSL